MRADWICYEDEQSWNDGSFDFRLAELLMVDVDDGYGCVLILDLRIFT
jgi:hypothetical protein